MGLNIESYFYGTVTKVENTGDYFVYSVITEDTKEEIKLTFQQRNANIGDEVEILRDKIAISEEDMKTLKKDINLQENENDIVIARNNITQNISEKMYDTIHFPTEIIFNKTEAEWREIGLQKMHALLGNTNWMKSVYDKYTYLVRSGSSTRGARDPYTPKTFTSTKLYIENARNILFFYCVEKAKEGIREEYYKGELDDDLFESFIKEYYLIFTEFTKHIPIPYQTVSDFESRFRDIRYEVGL